MLEEVRLCGVYIANYLLLLKLPVPFVEIVMA